MLNNEKEWSFDCNIYTFAKILLIFTRESNNFFICNKVLHSEKVRKKMCGPGWLRVPDHSGLAPLKWVFWHVSREFIFLLQVDELIATWSKI